MLTKLLVTILLALTAAVCACPNTVSANQEVGPRFEVDQTTADLGIRLYDQPAVHQFQVINTGDKPLSLFLISKNCGCVTDILPGSNVMPGESRPLLVGYTPKGEQRRHGTHVFAVSIGTNDPRHERVQFTVKAHLVKPVESEPAILDFGPITAGQTVEREIMFNCYRSESTPKILSVKPSNDRISLSLLSVVPTEYGARVKYLVKLNEDGIGKPFYASILAATDHPGLPAVEIAVRASHGAAIEVSPPRLLFGVLDAGTQKSLTATVRPLSEKAVPASASCPDEHVAVQLAPAVQQGAWSICVTLSPKSQAEHPVRINTSVTVLSTSGDILADIPVFGIVRAWQ